MSATTAVGSREVIATDLGRSLHRANWYVIYGATLLISVVVAIVLSVFEGFSSGQMAGLPFSGVSYAALGIGFAVLPLLATGALVDPASTASGRLVAQPARLVLGTWVARWVLAAGILVAAGPVLVVTALTGGVSFLTFLTAILIGVAELGVVAAIAVGLSALLRSRPAAVLLSYAAVLLLTVGTALVAPVTGSAKDVTVTVTTVASEYNERTETVDCLEPTVETTTTSTSLPNWGVLIANPFFVVADAAARDSSASGSPRDWFGTAAKDVRQAQSPQRITVLDDECGENAVTAIPELPSESWGAPLWYVGLGVHIVIAGLALVGGIAAQSRRSTQSPR